MAIFRAATHRHLRHRNFTIQSNRILLPHRRNLRIRRRIQKVNRIRHSALHRKLHRVQVIPQHRHKRQRIFSMRSFSASDDGGGFPFTYRS
jgi:hypothetical protein